MPKRLRVNIQDMSIKLIRQIGKIILTLRLFNGIAVTNVTMRGWPKTFSTRKKHLVSN
jgi:hypothetical protein